EPGGQECPSGRLQPKHGASSPPSAPGPAESTDESTDASETAPGADVLLQPDPAMAAYVPRAAATQAARTGPPALVAFPTRSANCDAGPSRVKPDSGRAVDDVRAPMAGGSWSLTCSPVKPASATFSPSRFERS